MQDNFKRYRENGAKEQGEVMVTENSPKLMTDTKPDPGSSENTAE